MRHACFITVGPARFRIGSDWRAPIDQLRALYADYPMEEVVPDFTVRLQATSALRRYVRPQVAIAGDFTLPDALPLPLEQGLLAAEMAMNLQMALGWRRHLLLHASAVSRQGRAVVMTGLSGAGKSTLSALLAERGWRFLGDEFVLLDPDSGKIAPFPRPVSLKNQAIAAMEREVDDETRFGPVLRDTPKGTIRHLRPRTEWIEQMARETRPGLLLFPRFGFPRAVRRMDEAESFVRLTQASTNYVALGERGFDALTGFVRSVPACAIDYATGDEGVELVERLWSEQGARMGGQFGDGAAAAA
ncbi:MULTISPECIES: HprK-related kinase A [Sphingomonadales]|nr:MULTISPECIES: HprK-related kinase A [Sphingomonadales]MAF60640.1 HprK-related kinase A [Blastomonas sp.]